MRKLWPVMTVVAVLAGCSLAPKLETPKTDFPSAFKEEGVKELGAWKAAEPVADADRGAWWKIFKDKRLDALEEQAAEANQELKIAAARVQESRAVARSFESGWLPAIGVGANAMRTQPSGASPFGLADPYTLYAAQAQASYEVDLFNRTRDEHKARLFAADAQAATYKNVLLALQADVAQHYFTLRALDTERAAVRRAVGIRAEGARIMQGRLKVGAVGEQDVARAEGELQSARADLTQVERRRASTEHALAVLLGQMPSTFTFKEAPLVGAPPRIPAGLPSSLLERRPDVSASFADMAAANMRIGAAKAAFFPDISLTASGGFEAGTLGKLFQWSSRTWAVGQVAGFALSLPIFDNGRRSARLDAARASYDASLATYRQQVLVAFRDVEDALSDQRLLAAGSRQQDAAAAAAGRAAKMAQNRYNAGEADYFEVLDANRSSLAADRAAAAVKGQRFVATVTLIRALGGGWTQEVKPAPKVKAAAKPVVKTEAKPAAKPETKPEEGSKKP